MNYIFFGTDEFSVKVLETLGKHGLKPKLVVTAPDKPQGRKMLLTPPPIKIWAEENKIEFIQPSSLKNLELLPSVQKTTRDIFIVASYGKIIPQNILDIPTHGTLNIHPSLLPKYRGPAPLETAILNGDEETGVTIIKLDAEMDHRPIIAQEKISLGDKYDFEQLRDKTAERGAEMIVKILPDWLAEKIELSEQNHAEATYTKKLTKEDGLLRPTDSAIINYRKILALNPWPGAYLFYPQFTKVSKSNFDTGFDTGKQTRIKIKSAHLEDDRLIFDRVIPEGKKGMNWEDFLRGAPEI